MATTRMSQPWEDPRTGVLCFRKKIPTRFRAVSGQSSDIIKISLGTSDRKRIAKPWAAALTRWGEMEAEWERRLNVVVLSHEKGREITAKWAVWIAGGAILHTGGENSDVFEPPGLPEERDAGQVARMWDRVEFHADEALRLVGLDITRKAVPCSFRACAALCKLRISMRT